MADFDPTSAKEIKENSGFDPSSAKELPTSRYEEFRGKRPSLRREIPEVATSTLAGAGLGFLAPEILTGLGIGAAAFPLTAGAAPALFSAGTLARGGRLAEAGLGALGGFGGSALPKVVPGPEKTLIPPTDYTPKVTRGEAAGVVGEMGAPLAASAAGRFAPYVVRRAFPQETALRPSTYQPEAREGMQEFRAKTPFAQVLPFGLGRISDIETRPQRAVAAALRSADEQTARQVEARLLEANNSASKIMRRYKEEADQAALTSRVDAERILNEGRMRAAEIMNKANIDAERSLRIAAKSKRIGSEAQRRATASLDDVGNQNVSNFETGSALQQRIAGNVDAEQKALNAEYVKQKKDIDSLIANKESQGIAVKDTKAFTELSDYIDKRLMQGKFKTEGGFAPVTESTLKNALENISKAIKDQQILIGIDSAGNPAYRKVPSSFDALDHVRRKLGEVFAGGEVEGFKGLLKEQAQDLYGLVRKAQVEYAGGVNGPFDNLLKNYSEGKELLNALKIPAGKKIVGTDKINPEYFTYDPSALGNEFFKTRKKVEDLINLTKDSAFVEQQASNHVARSLRGLNAKQASDYVFENKEWLDLFPQLKNRTDAYVRQISRSERISPVTEKMVTEYRGAVRGIGGKKTIEEIAKESAAKAESEAKKAAEARTKLGAKEAEAKVREGEKEAKRIVGKVPSQVKLLPEGNEVAEIEKIIKTADNQKLKQIASVVKQDETLANQFVQAVDITLSKMNPNKIYMDWNTKIKDPLVEAGLITPKKAAEIDTKIKTIQMTLEPGVRVNTIRYLLKPLLIGEVSGKVGKSFTEGEK